jgi:hypothetical protein
VGGLAAVCRYIGLPFRYTVCSELDVAFPDEMGPGDWAPAICSAIGASHYLNPIGGAALFDLATFAARRVTLQFAEVAPLTYQPYRGEFVENLSILDVLMWNEPAIVAAALQSSTSIVEGAAVCGAAPHPPPDPLPPAGEAEDSALASIRC